MTIDRPDQFNRPLLWSTYEKRVSGEVAISSILKENKYQLKENQGVCTYCNREAETTFDHVVAISSGGDDKITNMVPASQSYNSSKLDRNLLEWHKEHGIPVGRIVIGKYLKSRWDDFKREEKLDEPIPDSLRDRWDGIEITRRIDQSIQLRDRQ